MAVARLNRNALPIAALACLAVAGGLWFGLPALMTAVQPVFGRDLYRRLAAETLKLATLCTIISLVVGAPLAWTMRLASERLGRGTSLGIATPLAGILGRATGLLVVLGEFGLVNLVLRTLRVESDMPRRGTLLAELAVLGSMIQVFAPFMVLALYRPMGRIGIGTVRALRSLGMSHLALFWTVVLPLSLGGVAVGVATVFALATGAYVTVAVVGGRRVHALAGLAFEESTDLIGWQIAAVALVLAGTGLVLVVRRWVAAQRPPNSRAAAPTTSA